MDPKTSFERLKPHATTVLYGVLLGLLVASLMLAGGGAYAHYILLYAATLGCAYALFWRVSNRFGLPRRSRSAGAWHGVARRDSAAVALLAASFIFFVLHLVRLGSVPVVDGALVTEYFTVKRIRQDIFQDGMNPIWTYGPNLVLKCVLPFLVFHFLLRSRLWTAVALVLACLYGTALINKISVILPIIPAFVIAVLKRRWSAAVCLPMLPAVCIVFLVMVQNPHLRPKEMDDFAHAARVKFALRVPQEQREDKPNDYPAIYRKGDVKVSGALETAVDAIYRRVVLVPGEVMSTWFSLIPSQVPYANGCGYRWMAPFLGCRYVAYAARISDIENPQLVAAGVHGNMNSASFVEDYANFGVAGLIGSGIVFALFLTGIARLFAGNWEANLALNLVPLLLLLEAPLSTVLLTGGWLATLLLYLGMGRDREPSESVEQL